MTDTIMTEDEAAAWLKVPRSTLAAERKRGRVRPARIGVRIYRYTESMLREYLQRCQQNGSTESAITGSASAADQTTGAEPGLTPTLDKQGARALGQAMFRPQRSRYGNGSPNTGD